MNDKPSTAAVLCPSAQAGRDDATVFALVVRGGERRRAGYLTKPQPASESLLALAQPALPTEVFRVAARCATRACRHVADARCKLAARSVKNAASVVDRLPHCRVHPTCRWSSQGGKQACVRCPQIATYIRDASDTWRNIALPDRPGTP